MKLITHLCILLFCTTTCGVAVSQEPNEVIEPAKFLPDEHALKPFFIGAVDQAAEMKDCHGIIFIFSRWGAATSTCPPCKVLESVLESPKAEQALSRYVIVKLDSRQYRDESAFFKRIVPTILFYGKKGKFISRRTGADWGLDDPANIVAHLIKWFGGEPKK
jgi:thiol-disulfide isomerase/thioredoxin